MAQKKREVEYVDLRVAFDIETTSYRDEGMKKACVYSYAFSINGAVTVLRTAVEFRNFVRDLAAKYETGPDRRLVIWVHHLAYEYGFIRTHFVWESVFANGDTHKVIRAVTDEGIEFRCTLALTNASLDFVGKKVGVKKGGDFDYSLMRHSGTPLTPDEMGYIHNDVLIIEALLKQRLAEDTLDSIPLTKTGYVRRALRKRTKRGPYEGAKYSEWIHNLRMSRDVYDVARVCFQGGYTHANAAYAGKVMRDVSSCDIASSYPASLTQFMFPVTPFTEVTDDDLDDIEEVMADLDVMACMVDVTFHEVESRTQFPPMSESRCVELHDGVADNGRVFSAERARVMITDVDWRLYLRAYDIESFTINRMWVAQYGYLPSTLVGGILEHYGKKTTLKGVKGMEREYDQAKEDANSIYGMVATDPIRLEFDSDEHGIVTELPLDLDEALADHNDSRNRFLYYPWGAWVTAYSRFVLLSLIYDMEDAGIKVLYCDTDSIYFVEHPAAADLITAANEAVEARMEDATRHHMDFLEDDHFKAHTAAPRAAWAPMDKKGISRELGYFEMDEGTAKEFKTLGAKRYATVKEKDGADRLEITIAGLTKRAGDWYDGEAGQWRSGYITEHGGMDFFTDGMTIPAEHSGRLVHAYSQETIRNVMVDYLGNAEEVYQEGFIHLEASEYRLGISDVYTEFMQRMQTPEAFQR